MKLPVLTSLLCTAWLVTGCQTERTVLGVKDGANDLVKIADVVPEDIKKKIAEIKEGIKAFAEKRKPVWKNEA